MSMPALIDCFHVRAVVAGELVDRVVVGDQEALEAQLLLQDLGEQAAAAGDLLAVPAAERRHDRADAGGQRGDVARQVQASERGLVHPRVALVERRLAARVAEVAGLPGGAAVGDVVLRARQDALRVVVVSSCPAARARRPAPSSATSAGSSEKLS
jgi:hypothetical protein